jgi:cation-transporting ATPase E
VRPTRDGAAADMGATDGRALVAVSGAELAELSPEDFAAKADEAGIFGRVTPEQKQDLVEALRDRGRYVAMIGDGVNDVIALKQANVAVAMQGGSQAARSVGDLILMKDTFAPLHYAFREGQRIINGMNDILRIFMVRIFFKAAMIAIVTTIGRFPFAPPVGPALVLPAPRCRRSPSRSGRSPADARWGCSSSWRASCCRP